MTTKQNSTEGKLEVGVDDDEEITLLAENNTVVAIVPGLTHAHRLAACWNACEGIEEPGVVRELIQRAKEFAVAAYNDPAADFTTAESAFCRLEEALAKLEGKA